MMLEDIITGFDHLMARYCDLKPRLKAVYRANAEAIN